jgi:hypothetical protein
VKVTLEWLKDNTKSVDFLSIMKGWWSVGQFKENSSPVEWRTSKFRKSIKIIVILLARVFERKDASSFLEKWIPIIHQIITHRSTLNWGELISSSIDIQLKNAQREHQFYMSSYLLDVMCASQEYPSLTWRWKSYLLLIHVYFKLLWENKYKEYYELIYNELFATIYQILFGEEAPCLSPEGKNLFKEYRD